MIYPVCPTCKSICNSATIIYENVPVTQSKLYNSVATARQCISDDIRIVACKNCGAIFNESFSPKKVAYSPEYENRQEISPLFWSHIENMLKLILENSNQEPQRILEIGCGKGKFISTMAQLTNAKCFGYDPGYVGEEICLDGRLCFHKEYYNGQQNGEFDIVILRHLIEHVQDPMSMLFYAQKSLSNNGVLYIETPALEWIIQNNIIFDFPYEHCSYFTVNSMKCLLAKAGLKLLHQEYSFGGQYLSLIIQKSDVEQTPNVNQELCEIEKNLSNFELMKKTQILNVKEFLKHIHISGEIAFWGAAAKGVMCCNIFDKDKSQVCAVVDVNPNKQSQYIPISAHPVISPEQLKQYNIRNLLVTNSNYLDEILKIIYSIDCNIKVYNFEKMIATNNFDC